MMRRGTAILLAVLLCLLPAGCSAGGTADQNAQPETETAQETQQDDFWEETMEETSDAAEAAQDSADSADPAGEQAGAEADDRTAAEETLLLGEYDGTVYRQPYFGFQADFAGFTLSEIADRMELSSISADGNDSAAILEAIDRDGYFVDLQATRNGGAPIILVELMRQASTPMGDSESAMASTVAQSFASTMEDAGASDVEVSTATTTFLGTEREASFVKCRVSGVDIYEKIVVVKKGQYAAVILVSTFNEDQTDTYLQYFKSM